MSEPNVLYHIKHSNMINHYNNLKSIDINDDELKSKIDKETIVIKEEVKHKTNLEIPSEIVNNINKKPWIRIPYPIRELKLAEYMSEKNMTKEQKDTYLKLLYEKKLTNKVVIYNHTNGKIENIVLEN
jgi:hypothetical protein